MTNETIRSGNPGVAAARDANLSVLRELHLIASPGVSE
jgi:hypothetical protein